MIDEDTDISFEDLFGGGPNAERVKSKVEPEAEPSRPKGSRQHGKANGRDAEQEEPDPTWGEMLKGSKARTSRKGPFIIDEATAIATWKAPVYIVDGVVQLGHLYAITGKTSGGKTSVVVTLMHLLAHGTMLETRQVSKGTVLYIAAEDPDGVLGRWKAMQVKYPHAGASNILFILGGFRPTEDLVSIKAEIAALEVELEAEGAPLIAVFVDTAPALFEGDNQNDSVQMGAYARLWRQATTWPGTPAVFLLCHPPKHAATREELMPSGGGTFLNEIDGNLTIWRLNNGTGDLIELHHGKIRGPEFAPITFQLELAPIPGEVDNYNRQVRYTIAVPMTAAAASFAKADREEDNNTVLGILKQRGGKAGPQDIAIDAGWTLSTGGADRKRAARVLEGLEKSKFVEDDRKTGWKKLTSRKGVKAGKEVLEEQAVRVKDGLEPASWYRSPPEVNSNKEEEDTF